MITIFNNQQNQQNIKDLKSCISKKKSSNLSKICITVKWRETHDSLFPNDVILLKGIKEDSAC